MRLRASHLLWLLAAPCVASALNGCSQVLGLEDGVYVDAGLLDVVVDTDAAGDSAPPPKDVIDIEANFATCDGSPPLVADGVYVAVNGNDTANCGAPTSPCKTIATAIKRAAGTADKTVYLGPGTYDEHVDISSVTENGTVIQGGFDTYPDAAWVPSCDQQKAVIKNTASSSTVSVSGRTATLRLVRVESRPQAPPGESVYAVTVTNGALTLDNAILIAQNAGNGALGAAGGTNPPCSATSGSSAAGTAGGPGGFAPDFIPASGGAGELGALGALTSPGAGQCSGACGSCGPAAQDSGVNDSGLILDGGSFNMDAGIGGDAGGCHFTPYGFQQCATAGTGVCAAAAGLGGNGEGGGGASIALFVTGASSKVTFVGGVSLNTANGGNGGSGGAGGPGGMGGTGGTGSDLMCSTGCDGGACAFTTLAGGAAGSSTSGKVGGQGGGGAGGPTYLFVAPATVVDVSQSPNWMSSSKLGAGGTGGAPNGVIGEAKPSRTAP